MCCFHPIRAWQKNCAYIRPDRPEPMLYWAGEHSRKLIFKEPNMYQINGWRELAVPCGKCIGCLLDKANDWATRAYAESTNWKNNCFITLTYDNDHLPKDFQEMKRDMQKFFKRLRYYEHGIEYWENPRTKKHENPIRYIIAGEKGPKTKRLHMHALIFNWKPKDLKFYKYNHAKDSLYTSKTLEKIWGNGFVIIGNVTYQSACYVSRYVMKKAYQKTAVADLKEREFIETSRNGGIGLLYWLKNKTKIIQQQGILLKIKDKVKLKMIPKYFKRKWKEETPIWENPKEYYRYAFHNQKQGIKNMKEILSKTSKTESEYRKTQEEILREKAKILRRDNLI